MNMNPDDYYLQFELQLELMQIVIDGACASKLSRKGLKRRIKIFKNDLKNYRTFADYCNSNGELTSKQIQMLEVKFQNADRLLRQLEVELKILEWKQAKK